VSAAGDYCNFIIEIHYFTSIVFVYYSI